MATFQRNQTDIYFIYSYVIYVALSVFSSREDQFVFFSDFSVSRGARGRELSWKMILFRIFRFLGVKKSWVLVADNEGNTFWCAKYESIVGRKCFSSSRLPSSFAVSHVLVTRERIAHRKGCPAHFTPPTHARLSLARDALPIANLKWKACSLSCLSQILTFRVLHVSEVWTGRLSKPLQSTLPRRSKPSGLERSEGKSCELRVNPGNFISFCRVMNCPSVFCVLSLD